MSLKIYCDTKLFHSFDAIPEYKCLEPNCNRTYNSFDPFSKHTKRHNHIQPLELIHSKSTTEFFLETTDNESSNISVDNSEIISNPSITVDQFDKLVAADGITFVSKWYNDAVIPRNIVQVLINNINLFNDNCMQILKKEVLKNLDNKNSDRNTISKISNMFEIINNPFKHFQSEYKRIKCLEELGVNVKPIEIAVGSRNKNVMKDCSIVVEIVNVNICYISLKSVFKVFFEQPNVLKTVLQYFNDLSSMKSDIIYSFVQSEMWKERLNKNLGKIIILNIILYLYYKYFFYILMSMRMLILSDLMQG